MNTTGRRVVKIRARQGSTELRWLRQNVAIMEEETDERDLNYSMVKVVISDIDMEQFKKFADLNGLRKG